MPRAPRRLLTATLIALAAAPSAPAAHAAGDPVMPVADVREGMSCTALSVVRGTDIAAFDARIEDVLDDDVTGGKLILVTLSGAAVDSTGIGPGFSGSPIYCAGKVVAAIAYGIGEYGNKSALATPIEQMLRSPADPPRRRALSASRSPLLRHARPLTAPLTVTGLPRPALGALQRAARAGGRIVTSSPPSPLRSFPVQNLRPGSAMAAGLTTGAVVIGGVGTVSYRDGSTVWGFGHPMDAVGARSLWLQDAYVHRVVNAPEGTFGGSYKLAAPGHAVGTVTNDSNSAVVGKLGAGPRQTTLRLVTRDLDAGTATTRTVGIADETDVDQPLGASTATMFAPFVIGGLGPLALDGAPARMSGSMCMRMKLRERTRALRFCNTYVGTGSSDPWSFSGVPAGITFDSLDALTAIDLYRPRRLHIDRIDVDLRLRRGLHVADIVRAIPPRRAVRRGSRITVGLVVDHLRGRRQTLRFPLRVPRGLKPGLRTVRLVGTADDDYAAEVEEELEELFREGPGFDPAGDPGPRSLAALAERVGGLHRFDGVRARIRGASSQVAIRRADLRISGRTEFALRVLKR